MSLKRFRCLMLVAALTGLGVSGLYAQGTGAQGTAGDAAVVQSQEESGQGVLQQVGSTLHSGTQRTVQEGGKLWDTVAVAAFNRLMSVLPAFLKALVFLLAFWLLGKCAGATLKKVLDMTTIDERAVRDWGLEELLKGAGGKQRSLAGLLGALVKWLFILFGFVAFFNALKLDMVASPLQGVLDRIIGAVPNLLKAALILVLYWAVAAIARTGLLKVLQLVKFDERFGRHLVRDEESKSGAPSAMLGRLLFYLILLFGIPPFLQALGQQALIAPLQMMLAKMLEFLPNIFAALVIVLVGRVVATIVREVTVNLLAASGVDAGAQKLGFEKVMGKGKPSVIISKIVYFFILIPIIVAAVDSLGIKTLSEPIKATLEKILAAVPALLVAAVILVIGYIVAKVVRSLVESFLAGVGLDNLPGRIGLEFLQPRQGQMSLASLAGALVFIVIMLITAQQATASLNFAQLAELIGKLIDYLPSLAIGVVILLAALSLGKYVGNLVGQALANSANAGLLAKITHYAIVIFGAGIALEQLGVGADFITLAIGAVLGGVALALGLAFGLGGQGRAREIVERWNK